MPILQNINNFDIKKSVKRILYLFEISLKQILISTYPVCSGIFFLSTANRSSNRVEL